jgi:hypothetical protein
LLESSIEVADHDDMLAPSADHGEDLGAHVFVLFFLRILPGQIVVDAESDFKGRRGHPGGRGLVRSIATGCR